MAGTAASYKDGGGATRNRSVTTVSGLDLGRQVLVDETDNPISLATQATLAAILAKIIAAPATETTLASILAKLSSATSLSDATRLPISQLDGLAVSGSVSSAAVLFTQDMTGYESISVQVVSAGSGCTITYETSDDNTTWYTCVGHTAAASGSVGVGTTSTALGLMVFPRYGRYFRARVSTYGSGTVSAAGTVSKVAKSMLVTGQTLTVGGSVTTALGQSSHGAAIVNNPNRIAARARDFGTPYTAVAADQAADLVANLIGQLKVTREHLPVHINTATTTAVKAGKGLLSKFIVGSGVAAATATIYDSLTGTGTVLGVIDCAAAREIDLDIVFGTGLTIVTSGTADITIAYL